MVKVSVIIPVYNAEKYLRQCLDSVVNQTLREIEILCVDDGSQDGSLKILREYEAGDNRLHVLHNEKNQHAGPCRNQGLRQSRGEYVLFLDADDFLVDEALENLYKTAHRRKADVLRCRAVDYDNRDGSIRYTLHNGLKRVPFFLFGRKLNFRQIYWLLPKLNVAPWGGLCRRAFLEENSIQFNDLICVNDRSFYWESVIRANSIVLARETLVYYRTHLSDSLIGNRIRNFDCHFKSFELVNEHIRELPIRMRRCVLNAELLDLSNWLEVALKTQINDKMIRETQDFIRQINLGLWKKPHKTKWYCRITKITCNRKRP